MFVRRHYIVLMETVMLCGNMALLQRFTTRSKRRCLEVVYDCFNVIQYHDPTLFQCSLTLQTYLVSTSF